MLPSVVAGLPLALVLAMLTGFRWYYYGELLPNTYFAKTGASGWAEGLVYLTEHAKAHPGVWLMMVAGLVWGAPRKEGLPVVVATVGFLVYVASVGGDFKPTGRFVLPVVAWMAVAGAVGLVRRSPRVQLAVALAVFGSTLVRLPAVHQSASRWADIRHANLSSRALVGTFLRSELPPGTWIAIHSAGAVPFYSGLPTIDMWGLTDHHIARAPLPEHNIGLVGHLRGDPDYVFGRQPALYLPEDKLFTLRPWPLEVEPGFPEDFEDHYDSITVPLEGRFLNFWVRKGFFKALHADGSDG